ncbi:MAG: class I SAM-dependent methyltransferase [Actinomycetota bacterium]
MSDNPFGIPGYDAATYGDSFADVYDEWYGGLGDHDFVDALVRHMPAGPARVLELGVGTGRLLDRLVVARAGTADELTGVDTSDAMIRRAAAVPSLSGARLLTSDFSRSLPPGAFDLVFCGYNTLFNLPDDDAVGRALSLVRAAMGPGSRFVVDAAVARPGDAGDDVTIRSITADRVVLSVTRHDVAAQRIIGQFVELSNGLPVTLRPWSVRYLAPGQMDALAGHAGLRLVERHGDGRLGPFTPESRRHVSVYGCA